MLGMSQIQQLVDKEKFNVRKEIRTLGMLGGLLMALILVFVLYMIVVRNMANWILMFLMIPIAATLTLILFKLDRLTNYFDSIDVWLEQSRREYEDKKNNNN